MNGYKRKLTPMDLRILRRYKYGSLEYERMRSWMRQGIGISSYEEYEHMLDAQNHKCAICNSYVNGSGCLDHDHDTGVPRGILCNLCNKALGVLEFNLQQAINYIEAHERRKEGQ